MTEAEHRDRYIRIFSLIDFTSLNGTDSIKSTVSLCRKAMFFGEQGLPVPAAVCVFSPFVQTALRELSGSGMTVATVAGAFPHGQAPIQSKLEEVSFALDQGADEIDLVFSRGVFLSGDHQQVYDEIAVIREYCEEKTLKVILETGELGTPELISEASDLALNAGADFIKTSTGKIPEGATAQSVAVMLDRIRAFHEKTGGIRGIKPSGGISEPDKALLFFNLVAEKLGEEWLTKERFRIGASRLAGKLAEIILLKRL
ncbi:MAG: deoxyribose-phosphate aldolase [Bacteroidales bacterium]|nr:deoxyribose-phosphate aldolase [Bacteroidales bacterium]